MSNCNTLFVVCLNPASPNPSYALAFDGLGRVIETTTDPLNARAWFAFPAAAAAAALVVGRDFAAAVKEITANDSAVTAACTEWLCGKAAAEAAADSAAQAAQAAKEAADAETRRHMTDCGAAYGTLLCIKAFADDAAAALAAAMISAQVSKTRSFDAQALNAQAQCALVALEALASATACAARRSAGDDRATAAAAALKEHNRLECAAAHRAAGEAASALKALRDHNMTVLLTLGYDDQVEVIRAVFAHALGEGMCVGTESLRKTSPVGTMSAAGIRLHADGEGVMADFGESIGTATVLND